MRHARDQALDSLEPILEQLRLIEGLRERKRGIFYRGANAFLHFHEDPAGIFADIKIEGEWQRLPANNKTQRTNVLKTARHAAG